MLFDECPSRTQHTGNRTEACRLKSSQPFTFESPQGLPTATTKSRPPHRTAPHRTSPSSCYLETPAPFLTTQLQHFRTVFQHPTWAATNPSRGRRRNTTTRVVFSASYILLDRDEYHVPRAQPHHSRVSTAPLFSDVSRCPPPPPLPSKTSASALTTDFFRIGDWTVDAHVAAHQRALTLAHLDEPSADDDNHRHSPTIDARTFDPRTTGNNISSGFATDLRGEVCWIDKRVPLWAFGRTHYNFPNWKDEESDTVV